MAKRPHKDAYEGRIVAEYLVPHGTAMYYESANAVDLSMCNGVGSIIRYRGEPPTVIYREVPKDEGCSHCGAPRSIKNNLGRTYCYYCETLL